MRPIAFYEVSMNTNQVLDEIENIVDTRQQYDKLLSRSEASEYEYNSVLKVIGVGREESLYRTISQGHKYSPAT